MHIFKHIFRWGLIFGGHIFGGHFVLVSEYQDLKNSSLYIAIFGKKGVSVGQNHLYFALKPK